MKKILNLLGGVCLLAMLLASCTVDSGGVSDSPAPLPSASGSSSSSDGDIFIGWSVTNSDLEMPVIVKSAAFANAGDEVTVSITPASGTKITVTKVLYDQPYTGSLDESKSVSYNESSSGSTTTVKFTVPAAATKEVRVYSRVSTEGE